MAQRGTPRKLEARISWVGLGRVERPRCIKLLFRATTNTQTGIGCLQNLCLQLHFKTNSPPCLRKTDTKHWSRPVVWLWRTCGSRQQTRTPQFRHSLMLPSSQKWQFESFYFHPNSKFHPLDPCALRSRDDGLGVDSPLSKLKDPGCLHLLISSYTQFGERLLELSTPQKCKSKGFSLKLMCNLIPNWLGPISGKIFKI